MPSGGLRPNAPQNTFGVSATGGNGSKSGQPLRVAPGGKYGERTAMVTQQGGADMYKAPVVESSVNDVALFAPTQRPNEPISHGMNFDSTTPGVESLNLPRERSLTEIVSSLANFDSTGDVQELLKFVSSRGL